MHTLNKVVKFFLLLSIATASVTAVQISEGTEFILSDRNVSIVAGKEFNFDKISVYGGKLELETVNLSVTSNYSGMTRTKLEKFNLYNSEEPKKFNLSFVNSSNRSIHANISISLKNRSKESYRFSDGTSRSLPLNITVKSSERHYISIVDQDEKFRNRDDSSDSENTGSSSGSISIQTVKEPFHRNKTSYENSSQNETNPIHFINNNISIPLQKSFKHSKKIKIKNKGSETVNGLIQFENLTINKSKQKIEIEPKDIYSFNLTLSGRKNSSGIVIFNHSFGVSSLPVKIQIEGNSPTIRTEFFSTENSTLYRLNLSDLSENSTLITKLYDVNRSLVHRNIIEVNSTSLTRNESIKELKTGGEYLVVNKLISGKNSYIKTSKEMKLKTKKLQGKDLDLIESIFWIIMALSAFILVLSLTKIIKDRSSENFIQSNNENLRKSLKKSEKIIGELKSLQKIPNASKVKEMKARKALREDNYRKTEKYLEELSSLVKRENSREN